jgi:hypothetical protein
LSALLTPFTLQFPLPAVLPLQLHDPFPWLLMTVHWTLVCPCCTEQKSDAFDVFAEQNPPLDPSALHVLDLPALPPPETEQKFADPLLGIPDCRAEH